MKRDMLRLSGSIAAACLLLELVPCRLVLAGTSTQSSAGLVTEATNGFGRAGPRFRVSVAPTFKPIEAGALRIFPVGDPEGKVGFSRGSDQYLFTPETGCVYENPVVRADGRAVYFVVRKYSGIGTQRELDAISREYNCLAKFDIPDAPTTLLKTKHDLLLQKDKLQALFGGRAAWVEMLSTVSEDGERLEMNIAFVDATRARILRKSYWYWMRENRLTDVEH